MPLVLLLRGSSGDVFGVQGAESKAVLGVLAAKTPSEFRSSIIISFFQRRMKVYLVQQIMNENNRNAHVAENSSPLRAGTLGPSGSSSEQALRHFLNSIQSSADSYQLADSFEDVLQLLKRRTIQAAIVPHAYGNINVFYMDRDVRLANMFVFPTPTYGLARRRSAYRGTAVSASDAPVIVTHPAPIPLLSYLVEDLTAYRLEMATSTSAAAQRVRDGSAEFAITNEIARSDNDLVFINTYGPIVMSWSVFVHRKSNFTWAHRWPGQEQ